MKKVCTTMLTAVMALLMVVLTAACNNGGSANGVVGTWKMKVDADKVPEEQKQYIGLLESMMNMTITFTADGKIKVESVATMGSESSSQSTEGTWTQDGNTINVSGTESSEGAGMKMTTDGQMRLEGNKLYMVPPANASGADAETFNYIYFEKQ